MHQESKNKLLTWLVVLLLAANAATIAFFWFTKPSRPGGPDGTPQEFLIRQLKLDTRQQEQLDVLVREHRKAAEQLRDRVKAAKEALFSLIKEPGTADSTKNKASKAVSVITEELDLLTLNHFQKVRMLCTPEQQKKFDEIIHEVTAMIGQPRPPGGPGNGPQGQPPGGPGADNPPPPPGQ